MGVKKCKECGKFKNCVCKKEEVIEMQEVMILEEEVEIVKDFKDLSPMAAAAVQELEEEAAEKLLQEENMVSLYNQFVKELEDRDLVQEFSREGNRFSVKGLRKMIFATINVEEETVQVFTVLNKKEMKKENARNILTLKSLKALKSYTTAQSR